MTSALVIVRGGWSPLLASVTQHLSHLCLTVPCAGRDRAGHGPGWRQSLADLSGRRSACTVRVTRGLRRGRHDEVLCVQAAAGIRLRSVGSAADLQALYRRYSSAPAPQAQPPARKLSMHDSAGSAGLEDVARWGALPGVAQELSTLPRIVSAAWEGHVRRALSAATLARESHLDTHGAAVYARRGYQGWASAWPGVLMLPAALAGGIARWRRPAWPAPARPSR